MSNPGGQVLGVGRAESTRAHASELARRRAEFRKLGLAALALCAALWALDRALFPDSLANPEARSSYSPKADGFLALHRILIETGASPRRNVRPYTSLPTPSETLLLMLAPRSLMDLAMSGEARPDPQQRQVLRRWVESGGAVLGTPTARRTLQVEGFEVHDLDRGERDGAAFGPAASFFTSLCDWPEDASGWAGLRTRPLHGRISLAGDRPGAARQIPEQDPVWSYRLEAFLPARPENPTDARVTVFDTVPPRWERVALLDEDPILLRKAVGDGWIYAASSPAFFCNAGIGRLQLAEPALRMLATASAFAERRIYFDEFCHGVWRRRGVFGWFRERQLFYPLTAGLLWVLFVFWRGSARLLPPVPTRRVPRRAKEEYVIGMAGLMKRAGHRRAAAQWLKEHFDHELRDLPGGAAAEARAELDSEWNTMRAHSWTGQDLRDWAERLRVVHREHEERSRTTTVKT